MKTLRLAVVVFFGALLATGAFYYAWTGLVQGEAFCLLCKRGSAPAPRSGTPTLWVVSELMLLGVGALCLAATVYGLRDLVQALSGRPRRPAGDAGGPKAGASRPARAAALRRPLPATSTASAAPRSARPRSGWVVHVLAALCLLATLALGVLALMARQVGVDIRQGGLLLWAMPLATSFWGCVFLALSPRPGVRRVGLWLLLAIVAAPFVLQFVVSLDAGPH